MTNLPLNQVLTGHCLDLLKQLPSNSIHCCITSPPYYGLRDYNTNPVHWPAVTFAPMAGLPPITIPEQDCSLGNEADLWAYVGHLVLIFREVRRVMRGDGVLWLNLGDSFASGGKIDPYRRTSSGKLMPPQGRAPIGDLKPKDLLGIPHRVAFALQADGYYLRQDIPWIKRNAMPESVQDRPTVSKEYWFMLTKTARCFYDYEAVKMPAVKGSANAGARNYRAGTNGNQRKHEGQTEQDTESGRARRDSDFFFDSLRAILDDNAQILLTDEEGEPLALTVNPAGYKGAHFATFPARLIEPMVLASPEKVCGAKIKKLKLKNDLPPEKRERVISYLKSKGLV